MREKATRGVSPFLTWGDFHAPSRFTRSTIPEGKWGTTRSLFQQTITMQINKQPVDLKVSDHTYPPFLKYVFSLIKKKYCCGPNIAESLSSIHAYLLPIKRAKFSHPDWLKVTLIICSFFLSPDLFVFVSRIIWKEILYYFSSTFFSGLFKYKVLRYNTVRISNNSQVKASSSVRNNAPVNSSCAHTPPPPQATAEHFPALSVPGRGICKFSLLGARHLSTPGPAPNFWQARGFLSEYTYTEDFNGKTSRLAHLSRRRKNCKGMFSIWCMHLFIAY